MRIMRTSAGLIGTVCVLVTRVSSSSPTENFVVNDFWAVSNMLNLHENMVDRVDDRELRAIAVRKSVNLEVVCH
jgi:hypothetical protein